MVSSSNEQAPAVETTYAAAYAELQQIVRALQEDQIPIDELAAQIARATELIAFCRMRLRETETTLEHLKLA
jgi:exodeoxyribonuclease VII small subunit